MSTRRDDLVAALTNVEENGGELAQDFVPPSANADETPNLPENATASADRARDGQGRFTKNDPAQPNAAAVAGSQPVSKGVGAATDPNAATAEQPNERPGVPKSWKQDMRGRWDALDADTARYVAQREEEMARGIDQFRQQNEPALNLFQEVAPYMQDAQQRGLSMQQFVADAKDLFHTRDLLIQADPQTKLQTIVRIAHAAGLPLAQMLQGQLTPAAQHAISPEMMAITQRMQQLEGSINQRAHQEQMAAQQGIEAEVAAFATDAHPHFEALRESMAHLLQAGAASDLESAYSKALRLNDQLWEQDQARQRQSAESESRQRADKAAKAARSNAVSTRSATPGAVAATTGGAPKGRRAALADAFDGLTASRI